MLTITVGDEHFDDEKQEFILKNEAVLEFEHSLVSLSKWESKYEKPFLKEEDKSIEETFGYVEAMLLTPNVAPETLQKLTEADFTKIHEYINSKQTATWFNTMGKPQRSSEIITAELIYYWMFSAGIDISCENWHLNRLITLIKVFDAKNEKPKKMNTAEAARQRRELLAKRREQYGTRG